MNLPRASEVLQQDYYASTAVEYDAMHRDIEHEFALTVIAAYIEHHQIRSVLDVGAGTGNAMQWLKRRFPDLNIKGVEPVQALREQAYGKGISELDLVDGSGYLLPFPDSSFEMVCEFAVLHHVKEPNRMVNEMSRVASRMLCISDCNFMGQGSWPVRNLKRLIYFSRLWPLANLVKTKGKGYTFSKEDGVAYSYSVFQSIATLKRSWRTLRIMTASGKSDGIFGLTASAAHLLVIAAGRIDNREA